MSPPPPLGEHSRHLGVLNLQISYHKSLKWHTSRTHHTVHPIVPSAKIPYWRGRYVYKQSNIIIVKMYTACNIIQLYISSQVIVHDHAKFKDTVNTHLWVSSWGLFLTCREKNTIIYIGKETIQWWIFLLQMVPTSATVYSLKQAYCRHECSTFSGTCLWSTDPFARTCFQLVGFGWC